MLDAITAAELGRRWAYRATIEWSAAHRFARLADRMAAVGCAPALTAIARDAVRQEHAHVALCAALADRFGAAWSPGSADVIEVAPATWSPYARVVYEVVAFCCVTETSNTALVADGPSEDGLWEFRSRGRQSCWRIDADRKHRVNAPLRLRVNG